MRLFMQALISTLALTSWPAFADQVINLTPGGSLTINPGERTTVSCNAAPDSGPIGFGPRMSFRCLPGKFEVQTYNANGTPVQNMALDFYRNDATPERLNADSQLCEQFASSMRKMFSHYYGRVNVTVCKMIADDGHYYFFPPVILQVSPSGKIAQPYGEGIAASLEDCFKAAMSANTTD